MRNVFSLLVTLLFLSGCSSDTSLIHSPSYSDIKNKIKTLENEFAASKVKLDSQKDNVVPTIIQFGVVDSFYVNTDQTDRRKKIILPNVFENDVTIHTTGSLFDITTELTDFVLDLTGVNVVVNIQPTQSPSPTSTPPPNETLKGVMADNDTGTSNGTSLSDKLLGKPLESASLPVIEQKVKSFDFNGSVVQLINRLATMHKSKWKYSSINKDITLYNLKTRSFILPIPSARGTSSISVSSSASTSGGSNSGSTSSSLNSSNSSDPWLNIRNGLDSIITGHGKFIINQETGFVEVTDTHQNFPYIQNYLEDLITLYSAQLLVDVRVIHMSTKIDNKKEINWNTINNKIGQVVASSSFGNPANISAASSLLLGYKVDPDAEQNNISAAIDLLSSYAESYSVDSFSAITTNFTPIPIQISSETVFFNKTVTASDSDNPADSSVAFEANTKQLGTTITLTPSIISSFINLSYVFQKTHQTALVEDPSGSMYPLTATKTFVQNVKLKNGIPMVISAVNSEESSNNSSSPLATGAWFLGGSEGSVETNTKDIVLVTVSRLKESLSDYKKNYYDENIIPTSEFLLR